MHVSEHFEAITYYSQRQVILIILLHIIYIHTYISHLCERRWKYLAAQSNAVPKHKFILDFVPKY